MSDQQVIIYTPDSDLLKPKAMLKQMFQHLKESYELGCRLARRDISAQYRQSFLGFFWAFFIPLANASVWLFLRNSGIVKVIDSGIPYPVYVFSGTLLWQIFIDALQNPLNEVIASKGMLAKLNFPRESIIVSAVFKSFYNAGIKIIILFLIVFILGVKPSWSLLLFPLAVVSIILVGTTLGLFMVPVGALYTDVGKAIPLIAQFGMFISPVVFPIPKHGISATIFELNFITPLLVTARAWLTGTGNDWLPYFFGVSLAALVFLFIGWIIYRITMPVLIERMSA